MEWMKVIYEGEEVEAANFLDGVAVRFFPHLPPEDDPHTFVPGWKVEFRGDMDAPNFHKYPRHLSVFGLELREKE